jgi:hypothetical protein
MNLTETGHIHSGTAPVPVRKNGVITITFLLLLWTPCLFAQQIFFCESVDKDGRPSGTSNTFSVSSHGSYLNVLVKAPGPLSSNKVIYDVFRLDSLKKENFESSGSLNVASDWSWFKKEFVFYNPGEYVVYFYDETEKLIIAGKVKLVAN